MARKTQVVLVDDLTSDVLPEGRGQTVSFALDGTSYELDLGKENADTLRAELQRYVAAARKVTRAGRSTVNTSSSRGSVRPNTNAMREWARAHGHAVSDRGRIPAAVVAAFEAAH